MSTLKKLIVLSSDLNDFQAYLYERENSKSTIQKYMSDMKIFCRFMNGKTEIDKSALLDYKEWLIKHYAVSSVNCMLVSLNQYLEFKNLAALKLKRVKVQKQMFLKEDKNLTRKEYFRLINAAKAKNKEQLALIIETIGSTGIRISELSSFTVEQIKKGRVEIFNKGKRRMVIMPSLLRKKLLQFAAKQGIRNGHIFVTRTGKPKDRSNIWAEMKKLNKDAEVSEEKIFPHNLRHLFANCYYAMTKDLFGLADLLGHSSMETTRIYTTKAGSEFQQKIENLQLIC